MSPLLDRLLAKEPAIIIELFDWLSCSEPVVTLNAAPIPTDQLEVVIKFLTGDSCWALAFWADN